MHPESNYACPTAQKLQSLTWINATGSRKEYFLLKWRMDGLLNADVTHVQRVLFQDQNFPQTCLLRRGITLT